MPDKNHHVEFASLHSGAAAPHLTGGGGDGKIDVARNSTLAESEQRLVAEQRMSASTDRETGLTDALVEERRNEYGYNELVEKKVHPLLKFLGYFWGPMPIMIWLAILIELIKAGISGNGWEDFGVLLFLQIVNGSVGYMEEKNAGNAIAALKNQLAPQCFVKRNGEWGRLAARELVPGDLIALKLGDVVPADAILIGDDDDDLQIDQAALTGESLPVTIHVHGKVMMGSAVKRGEMEAVVVATGQKTFLGRAAGMMASVEPTARFQKILFKVTMALLVLSLVLCTAIFIKLVVSSSTNPKDTAPGSETPDRWLQAISTVVVLLVASIPIAMQVVSTSTMAVGARRLASRKVIVARLSAIEELAGMTILCSDKTGTLTKNKLELRPPILMSDMSEQDMVFYSALSAKRVEGNQDAIDMCICQRAYAAGADVKARLNTFEELKFMPFNPTDKRTEATVLTPADESGKRRLLKITKGAPQIVLRLALEDPRCTMTEADRTALRTKVTASIQELADRAFRALGVALKYSAEEFETVPEDLDEVQFNPWQFEGLLSMSDPPRDDSKETIEKANASGVEVKMITGDQTAIAKETCRELGMGTNILDTTVLRQGLPEERLSDIIFESNGFAEVMPEDKFDLVNALRKRGLVVGMTGDGVNDAPALKRADIGIAVEGATDAAKAAADIVLTEPGLSVIIDAMQRSRKIFQRMRNYAIYRISCTIQLLCFFFLSILAINVGDIYGDGTTFTPAGNPSAAPQKIVGLTYDEYGSMNSTVSPTQRCVDLYPGLNPPDTDYTCSLPLLSLHASAFVLPVISIVVITILNDGTIITIAYDKVVPHRRPQRWDLFEVAVVATVLGMAACVGSIVLLIIALHSNATAWIANSAEAAQHITLHGEFSDPWFGKLVDGSRPFFTYGEVQTIMYLKVSLSDFLTVFSARTHAFFFERRPSIKLGGACVVATGMSTLLSLVASMHDESPNDWNKAAVMEKLSSRGLVVLWVWLFCILAFVLQDLLKILTYFILAKFDTDHDERMNSLALQGAAGRAAFDAGRVARRRMGYKRHASALFKEADALVSVGGAAALAHRIEYLEQQLQAFQQAQSELAAQLEALKAQAE